MCRFGLRSVYAWVLGVICNNKLRMLRVELVFAFFIE